MSNILIQAAPNNLLQEKEKFFASSTYNPQFTYASGIPFTQSELQQWGVPQEKLYNYVLRMLPQTTVHTKNPADIITLEEIQQVIEEFNKRQPEITPLTVHFSHSYVSRCRVIPGNIYFQLPIIYSRAQFLGLMRHELETHILRLHNNLRQPWAASTFPDVTIRRTEEGLANLHTFLFREDKMLRKSFCSYLATWVAQQGSFREVYDTLRTYEFEENTAWNVAVKVKRGMRDTSKPGGVTKEVCYLEGTIQVWDWIINQKNDPHLLYLGRIGIEQMEEFVPLARQEGIHYPSFFDEMELYYTMIADIGSANSFASVL